MNIKFNWALPIKYWDKRTNNWNWHLPKVGSKMNINLVNEIPIKEYESKNAYPWSQVFTSGYRIGRENCDYTLWNGCVVIDLDTKHYYDEVKPFDVNKLRDALHEYLSYNEYNHYYCMQQSHSGKGYHIWFYFNVEKNDVNFKKCAQYSREIIKAAFYELGLKEIINYKNVLDSCTLSPYQGIYLTNRPFIKNEFIDRFFGVWDEIDEYALIERYKVKANDVNEDNTVNFKVLEYNDNGKSYKVEHRSRMAIYMTLVAAFKERGKVDKEWNKICYKIISQHDIDFLINEPNKNRWFDKYHDYLYMVDGDCLVKFGYEINRLFQPQKIEFYKPDVEYTLKENEFLSDIDINFSKDKVNHIFAGCGFGKTTWAKKLGKTNKVCFISPLTSINKSAFTDDNMELNNWLIIDSNFIDTAKHLYDGSIKDALLSNWNICTTWESFVLYEMYNIDFDYVIIDEIHTLYMYDYRLTSINNIKQYFKLAKGIKIVMTGTPSLEVKDFDCFKIKINKEQYKVNANLVFYNSQCKGYIYNDIKEWIKDKNHLAIIFKDTANYKDEEALRFEGITCDIFNTNYKENTSYIIDTENVKNQVTVFSVYGQAGINLNIDIDKKIRIYILNKNALGIIQYANRVRNKNVIDKVIIPYKKVQISNNVVDIDDTTEIDEIIRRINILNSMEKSNVDLFEFLANKNKSILKLKYGLYNDYLNFTDGKISLNEQNYNVWESINKVSKFESQIQVIYNRLIQNYFNVSFEYLDVDVKTNKATKMRSNHFAGNMINFDFDMIQFDKFGKIWIKPTEKFAKIITGDLIDTLTRIFNRIYLQTMNDFEKFKEVWISMMTAIIAKTGSITKADISNIDLMQKLVSNWDRYYDNAFIKVMMDDKWSDIQIAAVYTRSICNDTMSFDDIINLAEESLTKIKRIRKVVEFYSDIFNNIGEAEPFDVIHDTLTDKIYTHLYNGHNRGKIGGKIGKKVKDLETGIIYDTIVDYTNNLGKERKWAYRNKDKWIYV